MAGCWKEPWSRSWLREDWHTARLRDCKMCRAKDLENKNGACDVASIWRLMSCMTQWCRSESFEALLGRWAECFAHRYVLLQASIRLHAKAKLRCRTSSHAFNASFALPVKLCGSQSTVPKFHLAHSNGKVLSARGNVPPVLNVFLQKPSDHFTKMCLLPAEYFFRRACTQRFFAQCAAKRRSLAWATGSPLHHGNQDLRAIETHQ